MWFILVLEEKPLGNEPLFYYFGTLVDYYLLTIYPNDSYAMMNLEAMI